MSVINKMLRDLDRRNAPEMRGPRQAGSPLRGSVPSLSVDIADPRQASPLRWVAWGAAVTAAAASLYWMDDILMLAVPKTTVPQPAFVAPPPPAPAPTPAPAPAQQDPAVAGSGAASTVATAPGATPTTAVPAAPAPSVAPSTAVAPTPVAPPLASGAVAAPAQPGAPAASGVPGTTTAAAAPIKPSAPTAPPPAANTGGTGAAPVAAPPKPAPAPAPAPAASPAPANPTAAVAAAPKPAGTPPPSPLPAPASTPTPAVQGNAVATPATAPGTKPPVAPSAPATRPAAAAAAPAVPLPTPAPESADAAQQRLQQGGRDALTQAQGLWNAGSRDAAIDVLQQALASAERNGAAGQSLLLPLVRELTRMQLADGRSTAALTLLTRLEPQLAGEPDLWAVRANAAQRLGRHQESLQAYRTALQSRPNEQRWLLGAAVSLAALGQTTNANELAERARQQGPISRDVLTYLRQMGVQVRD